VELLLHLGQLRVQLIRATLLVLSPAWDQNGSENVVDAKNSNFDGE
jgi:hypothetical protein